MTEITNFIGGKSVAPTGSETYRRTSPMDRGKILAEYAFSSAADVAQAVSAARQAQKPWREMSAIARAEILAKAGAAIRARAAELGALMTMEMGKPLQEAVAEADYAGKVLQFYASEAQRPIGETLNSGRPNVHYYTRREPIGSVGAITPWNFPYSIACWKLGPALITGNTLVWKPAPHHPGCSHEILRALVEAGLPDGVVNMVHGAAETGSDLVAAQELAGVTFTGSTGVGQGIYRSVSHDLRRAQCEMGGKNALYVHSGADLEKAVMLSVEGAFRSAGQKCTATSRILVDKAIAADFRDMLVSRVRELAVGDPMDAGTFLGPVVDDAQHQKIRGKIKAAIDHGNRLIAGGLDQPSHEAYFILPTLFDGVKADDPIATEEVFGPVAAIIEVDGLEAATEVVNATDYGLSSTIVTRDLEAAHRFAANVETGVVGINLPTAGVELHAPFGGWKGSGLGSPEQGLKILEFYTKWRSVAMQFA